MEMPRPLSHSGGHGTPARVAAVATRAMDAGVAAYNTGWEDLLVPYGLALAGAAFDRRDWTEFAADWADHHLGVAIAHPPRNGFRPLAAGDGHRGIVLGSYCGDWGAAAALAVLPESRDDAVREVAEHILAAPLRLTDGTIAHAEEAFQPWVDTLYYSAAPLARAAALLDDRRYAEEAVRQCLLHARWLRDPRTGCFVHEADPERGRRAGWLWSRGNGWVAMTFADVLRDCPPETPGWDEVAALFRDLVEGLLRFQHACGLWRIVPEVEEAHLETSGSAMIATGIAVGVAEGLLEPTQGEYARRTWTELLGWIDDEGRVHGCQTPAGIGGWETHRRSGMGERTYGTGSVLRLAAELRTADLI